jgi:hypothetical protein
MKNEPSINAPAPHSVESMFFEIYGNDMTSWTPEQRQLFESLTQNEKSAQWDNLPEQIEEELWARIEALLTSTFKAAA